MPKARPIYKMTPTKGQALRAHLTDALEKRLTITSKSSYRAYVLFVAKKGGSLCLIINYYAPNEATIKNSYHLPLIDKLFYFLGGSQCFSKINLTAEYNQIRVREKGIPKTYF